MSFLREIELENTFGPFVAIKEDLGFVPNLLRAQSLLPRLVEVQSVLESAIRLHDGATSRVQKERILLRVAAGRQDAYCVGMSRRVLLSWGVSDSQINGLLNDYRDAGLPAAEVAMLDFCLKLSHHALSISSEDVEGLRAYGFSDESIIDAVYTTALAVYRCTLSVGLGPEPDFAPQKAPLQAINAPQETYLQGSPRGTHQPPHKEGPYVRAPYLSPKTFAPFAILFESHGFIPNFFRAQTLRPQLIGAEANAVAAILLPDDILTRSQKEIILLAVSASNLNSYCVAVHCNMLRGLGVTPEEGDQIAVNYHHAVLAENDKALLDFAVKLGTHFPQFSRGDVVKLRALGFSDEHILECEVVTGFNNFANVLQIGLGVEPDFEVPLAYQENKAHLSVAVDRPIPKSFVVPPPATTVDDPDAGLADAARAGSLEAFEELIRRHRRLVYRALAAILGNQDDAQDAMQDTLLNAFKHIAGFQGRSKFSTWLVSIARNTAIQRLRGPNNEESLDEGSTEEDREFRPRQVRAWQDDPEQLYSRLEMQQLVERGIMGLPAKYRTVVMLRDVEQLSTDEVARQLGLSVPAVKVRLLRGRLMLRECLSPHFAIDSKRAAQ